MSNREVVSNEMEVTRMLRKARRVWLCFAVCAVTAAMVGPAFADLDNSSWPVAGQSRATRESVSAPSIGDAMQQVWNISGTLLPNETTGTGGGVLSSDGYLWFRTGGAGNLYRVNTADGTYVEIALGSAQRSAPLVTDDGKVYVSHGDRAEGTGIKVFDRSTLTELQFIQDPSITTGLRSLQLGSVTYDGNLRIYTTRRAPSTSLPRIQAWDMVAGTLAWEIALPEDVGNGGLCQLGPLWVDGGTGKQMLAFANRGGATPTTRVYQIRDDGASATVLYNTVLSVTIGNYVNGQGALSADGQRIYYNMANDGGCAALWAVSTVDGSVAWSVPQSAMAVNCFVANPAVIGSRVYLACAGGNVVAVDDTPGVPPGYSVAWLYNVGEAGEFTSIAAQVDPGSNRKYLYCANTGSLKLYRIEDLGASATTLGTISFVDQTAYGGSNSVIDSNGAIYQFGGNNGGVFKYITGTPPVAEANGPYAAACYGSFNVDATGSHGVGGPTIVNYEWSYGTSVLYSGPDITTSVSLPVCEGTYPITLKVTDSTGFSATDTASVTVGDYPAGAIQFTTVNGPAGVNGDNWKNSLATDGTYLYYFNNNNGRLFRTVGGVCNLVWEELATCPGLGSSTSSVPPESGSLAYYNGMLITKRRFATTDPCFDHYETLVSYDIAGDTWTQRGCRSFGGTGFVVAGDYLFANVHAVGTNQGGPLARANLATGLDNYTADRSGIWQYLLGADPTWMSRVVQMALVTNSDGTFIYGFKNDWTVGADGDRLFKFNPASYSASTWTGDPGAAHCPADPGGPGALWQNWTTAAQTPATDLGDLPFEPGYGSALVALPAGWKGVIGAKGGLFFLFGQQGANHEGWSGTPNNQYAYLDLDSSQWSFGLLPDWSTNGTAAVFFNGEVWIKQGCSSSTDPNATPTNEFWISIPPPTIEADAGPDQSYVLEDCATQAIELHGTVIDSNPNDIDAWEWTDQTGRVLGTSQDLYDVKFLPGVYTITLTATDDDICASDTDTLTVTIDAPTQTLPVELPMDEQVNHDLPFYDPAWDLIQEEPSLPPDNVDAGWLEFLGDPDFCTRFNLYGGSYYAGPTVRLENDCYGPIDVTNAYIRFEARYYQDVNPLFPRDPPAYSDAPIGIRFRNANLTDYAALGVGNPELGGPGITWLYGPSVPVSERYPLWKTCGGKITLVDVRADRYGRTADFDPTQVTMIEFVGTDWSGYSADFLDLKNLLISPDPLGACCLDEDTCIELRTEAECTALGGVSWHADEPCGALVDTYTNAGATLPLIDISSTGTPLVNCDDCGYAVPLGFTFNFYGQDITEIGVASNGYLTTEDGLGNSGNGPIPSTSSPNNMIAVLWHDWEPGFAGAFYYQTLGTAPNRYFVALWKDVAFWHETSPTNTFEAILYEGTNLIELRYGAVNPTSGTPSYSGATTIGVEGPTGTYGTAVTAETIYDGGDDAGQIFTPVIDDQRICAAALLGDLNCDGVVNVDDLAPFAMALVDPAAYNTVYPDCDINLADCNLDGLIDGQDVQAFTDILVP